MCVSPVKHTPVLELVIWPRRSTALLQSTLGKIGHRRGLLMLEALSGEAFCLTAIGTPTVMASMKHLLAINHVDRHWHLYLAASGTCSVCTNPHTHTYKQKHNQNRKLSVTLGDSKHWTQVTLKRFTRYLGYTLRITNRQYQLISIIDKGDRSKHNVSIKKTIQAQTRTHQY